MADGSDSKGKKIEPVNANSTPLLLAPSVKLSTRRNRSTTSEGSPTRSVGVDEHEDLEGEKMDEMKEEDEEEIKSEEISPPISPQQQKSDILAYSTPSLSPMTSPAPIPINLSDPAEATQPLPILPPYHVMYPTTRMRPADYIPYNYFPPPSFAGMSQSPPFEQSSPLPIYEPYSPHYPSFLQIQPQMPHPHFSQPNSPPPLHPPPVWSQSPLSSSTMALQHLSPFATSSHSKDLLNTLAPPLVMDDKFEIDDDGEWPFTVVSHDEKGGMMVEEGEGEEEMGEKNDDFVNYSTFVVGVGQMDIGVDW